MTTLIVLALGVWTQQDAVVRQTHELVEKLRSDSIDTRASAAEQLIKLGDSALPALQEASKSNDIELASRARSIVETIAARSHQNCV